MLAHPGDVIADREGRAHVADLQPRLGDWWLMYSRRRRCLVAFYQGLGPPGGIVVEAVYPEDLLRCMSDAVHRHWRRAQAGPAFAPQRLPASRMREAG
jgi:hypothetical protein